MAPRNDGTRPLPCPVKTMMFTSPCETVNKAPVLRGRAQTEEDCFLQRMPYSATAPDLGALEGL